METKIGHSSETPSARPVPQALGVGSNIGAFITLPIIINIIIFGVTQNIAPDVTSVAPEQRWRSVHFGVIQFVFSLNSGLKLMENIQI